MIRSIAVLPSRLDNINPTMGYVNFGWGIVTAAVFFFEGWLSLGWAIAAGIAVATALTAALFHPITKWIVAGLGTLMAAGYLGAAGWFLGGISLPWGIVGALAGAIVAALSYRAFLRAETEASSPH